MATSIYCDSTLNITGSNAKKFNDSLKNQTETGFTPSRATITAHSFLMDKPSAPYSGNLSLPSLEKSNETLSSHTAVGLDSYALTTQPIQQDNRTVTTTIPIKTKQIDDSERIFTKSTRIVDETQENRLNNGQSVITYDDRIALTRTESRIISAELNPLEQSSAVEKDYFSEEMHKQKHDDISQSTPVSSPTNDIVNPELNQKGTIQPPKDQKERFWNRRRSKICIFILAVTGFILLSVGVTVFVLFVTR